MCVTFLMLVSSRLSIPKMSFFNKLVLFLHAFLSLRMSRNKSFGCSSKILHNIPPLSYPKSLSNRKWTAQLFLSVSTCSKARRLQQKSTRLAGASRLWPSSLATTTTTTWNPLTPLCASSSRRRVWKFRCVLFCPIFVEVALSAHLFFCFVFFDGAT